MNTPVDTRQKKEEMLKGWLRGLRILQKGNFNAATYYSKLGKRFGVPVVITTSIVSSAIFATLGTQCKEIQIAAGFISILATILASLQTFLGYAERSSSHKEAAVGYGELRTEVQVLLTCDLMAVPNLDERIESIRKRWSALDKASPTLPTSIYETTARTIENAGQKHKNITESNEK
jgi:hypothetical protein